MEPSAEKSNWMLLAASQNPEDRHLALELAAAIRDQIQDELLILLAERPAFSLAQRIFELLDDQHRQLALKLGGGDPLQPLRPHHNLAALRVANTPEEKLAILRVTADGLSFFKHKMLYAKYYRDLSGRRLGEARDNMALIFHRARDRDPLAGMEEEDAEG